MSPGTDAALEEYPCGPLPGGADAGYWEGLKDGEVRIPRCRGCGSWLWPARGICGRCLTFDLGWEPVEARGTVFTWIRTRYPYMSELADAVPYVSVLAELPHAGGVRLLGLLTGPDGPDGPDEIGIGDRVTGVIERPPGAAWPILRWVAGRER